MSLNAPIHTGEQSIDRVLGAGIPVLLVFWSRDCAPCKELDPILARIARSDEGRLLVAKIETSGNQELVRRYNVERLPDLVFLRDGEVLARAAGVVPEPTLRAWLDSLVRGAMPPEPPAGPTIAIQSAPPPSGRPRAQPGPVSSTSASASRPPSQSTSSKPVTLSDASFNQLVATSPQPVLVDFWAPWCGPCRALAPTIEQLAREFAGRAVVGKLNVDDYPAVAQRFGIQGIPAVYIFRRGVVVERLVGVQPAPVLRQSLQKHIS